MRTGKQQQGFTLVELSIVLVVIALVIAGIVVGKSMIRQTQVMSVMTDVQSFKAAIQNFQTKYNALPGDMANATSYWGAVATPSNTNTCYTAVGTGTKTCDGNGDGQINWCWYEANRAWQHLANAGMIQGNYSQSGNECWSSVPGTDLPRSKIDGYYFMMGYRGVILPGDANEYPNTLNHVIYFTSGQQQIVGLTAAELYAMDSKYDDGYPATGNIIASALVSVANGCVINPNGYTNPLGAVYNASNTGGWNSCYMYFKTGF